MQEEPALRGKRGRARSTTRPQIAAVALDLFIRDGYEAVTVEDIAAAAGISRRTFFRYFESKQEVPWGDFEPLLAEFETALNTAPSTESMLSAIRRAVHRFNDVPASELAKHRHRMRILLSTPELVAFSTVRYASWRLVVARFVAARLGTDPTSPVAQAVSWACLGVSLSAYERWIDDESADLQSLIDDGFGGLSELFVSDVLAGARSR